MNPCQVLSPSANDNDNITITITITMSFNYEDTIDDEEERPLTTADILALLNEQEARHNEEIRAYHEKIRVLEEATDRRFKDLELATASSSPQQDAAAAAAASAAARPSLRARSSSLSHRNTSSSYLFHRNTESSNEMKMLQKDIRDLKHKTQKDLDEVKADLKSDIEDLKQHLRDLASTTSATAPASSPAPTTRTRTSEMLVRNEEISSTKKFGESLFIGHDMMPFDEAERDDESKRSDDTSGEGTNHETPQDIYTLMMMCPLFSIGWFFSILAFAFQLVLVILIAYDQLEQSKASSLFNIPFKVNTDVRAGQFLAIILALAAEDDIRTSVSSLVMVWIDRHSWNEAFQIFRTPNYILPNVIKFLQGILMMVITFVAIVQSDNIINLLKVFAALMLISETKYIFFAIAADGYLGSQLQRLTIHAKEIRIKYPPASKSRRKKFIRPGILLGIALLMFTGWSSIVINQVNGTYFHQRYPGCNVTPDAFQLATEHFGDEVCYGGTLNTLECGFEGGDCVNFNLAYPLCRGVNRTDVQNRVGNGNCEKEFMSSECDYDGGDCCPYDIIHDPSFGDGTCHDFPPYNSDECGFDGGDCERNPVVGYPECFVHFTDYIGDGFCNDYPPYNTEECGFDGGDCNF